MKHYFIVIFLISIIYLESIPPGKGTENAPYRIDSLDDLIWVKDYLYGDDRSNNVPWIVLDKDIDMSDYNENCENGSWSGIGGIDGFNGHFDGQFHTIYNFKQNSTDEEALLGFFCIIRGGTVKNLIISDALLNGYGTGGILSFSIVNSTVEKCKISGKINTHGRVSGLSSGAVNSIVQFCTTNVEIGTIGDTYDSGGAFVNASRDSSFDNCYIILDKFMILSEEKIDISGIIGSLINSSLSNTYIKLNEANSLRSPLIYYSENSNIKSVYWLSNDNNFESGFFYSYQDRIQNCHHESKENFNSLVQSSYDNWKYNEVWLVDQNINEGSPYLWWEKIK